MNKIKPFVFGKWVVHFNFTEINSKELICLTTVKYK